MTLYDKESNIKSSMDVSIVIVNYKSWIHLNECLNSIISIDQNDFSFEVIVVDNQSNDNKLSNFSKQFNQFKFYPNIGNNGFSSGCNLGVAKSIGNYILFLNPDTIITKDALTTLLKTALENPKLGAISCSKVNMEGKPENEIRFFPKPYTLFGFTRAIYDTVNKNKILAAFHKSKLTVFPDWVSGSIIFTSKSWFQKVNGWNEDYWLYLEDVDFCKKISKAGGIVALTRSTQIIHNHGGASRLNVNTSALTKAEVIISKHTYIQNHFVGLSQFISHVLLIVYGLTIRTLLALIGLVLFFIPKLYVQFLIYAKLISYYSKALINQTWISPRAPNNKNFNS